MTTYAEFIAACGTTDESNGDFAFEMKFLPFIEMAEQTPTPPPPWVQCEVRDEIMRQLVGYVHHAITKRKDDVWKPFQIMARAEKLIDIYVQEQFDELIPLREDLRRSLHNAWRCVRRRYIRAALKCGAEELPLYLADMRDPKLGLDGPDGLDDFRAAERHVDLGVPLMQGLCRSKAERR
jgi:hypothetical protein